MSLNSSRSEPRVACARDLTAIGGGDGKTLPRASAILNPLSRFSVETQAGVPDSKYARGAGPYKELNPSRLSSRSLIRLLRVRFTSDLVDFPELPRPAHVVQERPQVEPVVLRRVVFRVVRRRQRRHLMPVRGVEEEEPLHFLRDLVHGESVLPLEQPESRDLSEAAVHPELFVRHSHVVLVVLDVVIPYRFELSRGRCFLHGR
eukprot:30294-Pelagococcus_subviridis.AAC.52